MKQGWGVALLLIGLCPWTARADVPHLIRYQGQATEANGVPLEGPYTLTFRLYPAETGGTAAWMETQLNVPLAGGHFSVLLGQVQSLTGVDWTQPLWLSVQVNTEPELSPRQRIASVPLALRSESALEADDLSDHQRVLGPIQVAGNDVGIGTASPAHRLDVQGTVNATGGLCLADDCKANWAAVMPVGGRIRSIRQGKTSSGTTLNFGWQTLAASVTISPASAASTFVVTASAGAACASSGCGSSDEWAMRLVRNGTPLQTLVSDEGGAEGRSAMHPMTFTYFDQPATTSTVTYQLQARSMATAVFRVPGAGTRLGEQSDAVITVMEIDGI
jgi:hypothetical protein